MHYDNAYKDFTYNDFTYNINKCDMTYNKLYLYLIQLIMTFLLTVNKT